MKDKIKEWELETRIKHLEGNDLETIYDDYCKKIDEVTAGAETRLELLKYDLNNKSQKAMVDEQLYRLIDNGVGIRSAQASQIQFEASLAAQMQYCNDFYGHGIAAQAQSKHPFNYGVSSGALGSLLG